MIKQTFSDLDLVWKILIIVGSVFVLICIALIIFIVILLKTDIIKYLGIYEKDPDITDFDYLFNENNTNTTINDNTNVNDDVNDNTNNNVNNDENTPINDNDNENAEIVI